MEDKSVKVLLIVLISFVMLTVFAVFTFVVGVFIFTRAIKESPPEPIEEKEYEFIKLGSYDEEKEDYDEAFFTDYDDYKEEIGNSKITKSDFKNYNVLIFEVRYDTCGETNIEPTGYYLWDDEIWITLDYDRTCNYCESKYMYYALKLPKDVEFEIVNTEFNQRNFVMCPGWGDYQVDKPMIYIYPEEDMEVEVKLGNSNLLTTSYPKYNNGWKVFAKKDGTLLTNDKEYYGLYWEGKRIRDSRIKDGFIVKGEETTEFLEEKLEILGLNSREINEFIVYWLPKLEKNKYNYIRFETNDEIDKYMPLKITPEPDTVIRVYMTFKALDKEIEVKEQKLNSVTREGYTVIEWGGSDLSE